MLTQTHTDTYTEIKVYFSLFQNISLNTQCILSLYHTVQTALKLRNATNRADKMD